MLVEQFIEGREFYVGVLGNANVEALPVIELDFSGFRPTSRGSRAGKRSGATTATGTGAEFAGTKSIFPDGLDRGARGADAAGRGRGVPCAAAARLRAHRPARDAERRDLRDRGESELLSRARERIRARRAETGIGVSRRSWRGSSIWRRRATRDEANEQKKKPARTPASFLTRY